MLVYRKSILGTGLALLLLASTAFAVDSNKYVPANVDALVHVNVQQIVNSPLFKKHGMERLKAEMKKNEGIEQMLKALGLDPFKDISTVLVAAPSQDAEKGALIIIDGKFDLEKIQTVAKTAPPDKLKVHKAGNLTVYETSGDQNPGFITFPNNSTMLISPTKDLVVSAARGDNAGKINKDLKAALGKVDTRQSVWLVMLVPDNVKQMLANQPQAAAIAPKLKALMGAISITQGVGANVQVQTTDRKAAADLAEFADQAKGVLAFTAQSNEELAPFINEVLKTLKIQTNNTDLSISFSLSEKIVEEAIKKIPQ